MTRYEFEPSGRRRGRNRYVGKWTETSAKVIPLSFTAQNLEIVLCWGAKPDAAPFSHQDIAHWCSAYEFAVRGHGTDAEKVSADIALDVDAQWDMFLANTYCLAELQQLDFSKVRMPVSWFEEWLTKLKP